MITTRGLGRTFRQRGSGSAVQAVTSVDLDVAQGEIVGFLGPNGAGKTTTMRMLTTLLRPTSGEATVAGHDLRTDPVGVRARIGYVAQNSGVAPESRVVEELELQGRLYDMSKKQARHRAAELTEELDLSGFDNRPVRTLSGGQRRRLDIGLGLIHTPSLVFLDEPTTGLDPLSRANLWRHISRLRDGHGMTVFLTTHYLDEADTLADRIFVLDHGTIVASGTPDELKSLVYGDGVTMTLTPASLHTAANLATRLAGARDVTTSSTHVEFRVPNGGAALPELVRALDRHQIEPLSIQVTRPSLDDVFFSLTGRSLRDSVVEELAVQEAVEELAAQELAAAEGAERVHSDAA
ncbi:MAG TPA: ATP-binding cassette domain-containing protein [Pseudonocardiaceae bacterium]|nr:ATP-binding cassette domain-containing protein [Pseudonocardiaceae bacterium]